MQLPTGREVQSPDNPRRMLDALQAHEIELETQKREKNSRLSPEETRSALHELRVHQIELEMQNEELRRAHLDLDATRLSYVDLFELAPVGYCILDRDGVIQQANHTATTLLDAARDELVGQTISRLIFKEDQDIFYLNRKRVLGSGKPQSCELRMVKRDSTPFWVHLAASCAPQVGEGSPPLRIAFNDITERKQQADLIKEHNAQLTRQKAELEATLGRVKRLEGMLSICMTCKKIRVENSDWHQLEGYIGEYSDTVVSHGICPQCLAEQVETCIQKPPKV